MSSASTALAIIIVGYKSREDLPACLGSIEASTFRDYTIIFVDNASADGSVEYVRQEFPGVTIVESKENLGFAGGNNLGVEHAKQLGVKYVFLLNPDATVDTECLAHLMRQADVSSIIQPVILLDDQPDKINTAGNVLHYLGFSYCGHYKEAYVPSDTMIPATVMSGAAVLIPMAIIQAIGLFDQSFFLYHEDTDFSWRAQIAGYHLKCLYSASVRHRYQFSRNMKKMYYTERNRWLHMLKNYQLWTLILLIPAQIVNELSAVAFSIVGGWFPEKMRSYAAVILALPRVAGQRRIIRAIRQRSDRALAPLLSDKLDFSEVKIPLLGFYNRCIAAYWRAVRVAL